MLRKTKILIRDSEQSLRIYLRWKWISIVAQTSRSREKNMCDRDIQDTCCRSTLTFVSATVACDNKSIFLMILSYFSLYTSFLPIAVPDFMRSNTSLFSLAVSWFLLSSSDQQDTLNQRTFSVQIEIFGTRLSNLRLKAKDWETVLGRFCWRRSETRRDVFLTLLERKKLDDVTTNSGERHKVHQRGSKDLLPYVCLARHSMGTSSPRRISSREEHDITDAHNIRGAQLLGRLSRCGSLPSGRERREQSETSRQGGIHKA